MFLYNLQDYNHSLERFCVFFPFTYANIKGCNEFPRFVGTQIYAFHIHISRKIKLAKKVREVPRFVGTQIYAFHIHISMKK